MNDPFALTPEESKALYEDFLRRSWKEAIEAQKRAMNEVFACDKRIRDLETEWFKEMRESL